LTFQLEILGNNAALPALNRHQTAQLLRLESQYILIDCGEGTQRQLAKQNIRPGRIQTVLISHLHGDHYFGLIALISSMHLLQRRSRLTIVAPPMLEEIIKLQLRASGTSLGFELVFVPLWHHRCRTMLRGEDFYVEAFPLDHGISCYGFRISEFPGKQRINKDRLPDDMQLEDILQLKEGKDVLNQDGSIKYSVKHHTLPPNPPRSYAYCSDTRYLEEVIPYIHGVDMLYHEATFSDDMKDKAVLTGHSTATEAATIAMMANVGKLVLGHFSTRFKDPEPLLLEARKVFQESYLSFEGQTIALNQ
jgi:ribonuclease Z